MHHLAIETSCGNYPGGVCLGRDDRIVASAALSEQRRHNVELMAAIDRLLSEAGVARTDLGHVYVSIGPGSFTGLRVAVAAAKMLAMALGLRVAAVPTLDVVARNAPPEVEYVAVGLNTKQLRMYAGVYRRTNGDWEPIGQPGLLTPEAMCEAAPRPLTVIGDALPAFDWPTGVSVLTGEYARPHCEVVYALGRRRAAVGRFADPTALTPLYARLPEAQELWERRHGMRAIL